MLGRKGYGFWFSGPESLGNVQILFHDLHLPLPDGSVAMVIGMDVLHRHDLPDFVGELLRVVRADGGPLFPHVHLANAEPVPYFKRGGHLQTGHDYEQQISGLTRIGDRRTFVFSEPDLFHLNTSAPAGMGQPPTSTPDYNALIAVLPPAWAGHPLVPFRAHEEPDWIRKCVLLNNLVTIDYTSGLVQCLPGRSDGMVGHLLERHPVYDALIRPSDGYVLSETALCFLYWAARQLIVAEIAGRLNQSVESLRPLVTDLARRDLIQLVPVSAPGARLQHYLSFQTYEGTPARQTLPDLWQRAVALHGDRSAVVSLEDDSTFSYDEADQIISRIRSALTHDGLRPGDRVLLVTPFHAESLLLSWACWQNGLVVVPVSPDLSVSALDAIARLVRPSLVVTVANGTPVSATVVPVIWLDMDTDAELPLTVRWFADWAGEDQLPVEVVHGTPDDVAAILFTSGSTGQPKGVPLTHGQLCRSGRLMTETFGWEMSDRLLAVGHLDSMSGLRNVTSAVVEVGATVVIPALAHRQSGASMAGAVGAGQATLVAVSPSLLRQWVQYDRRVTTNLRSLRLVMSTGSLLTTELRQAFDTAFSCPIVNYYGLTETAGICLAEPHRQSGTPCSVTGEWADTIGWPVGCLAQVVDDQHRPVAAGDVGELRIYGDNNMTGGYVGQVTESPVVQGWLYTGDLAVVNLNGSLTLRGRQSERIKNAHSEVVYPSEVEAQLLTHPAVADAVVCAFVRHDTETLAAFLTVHNACAHIDSRTLVADLSAYLLARVGPRKMPAVFRILAEMPRTTGGKIRRQTLLSLIQLE